MNSSSSISNPNIIEVDFESYDRFLQQQQQADQSPRQEYLNRQPSYARAITNEQQTRSKSSSSSSSSLLPVAARYQNPYYKGTYLSPEKQARMQNFSTEKTQVNIPSQLTLTKPEIKQRQSVASTNQNSSAPIDIDFSAYEEPSMSLQHGSTAKIVRYF